MNVALAALLPNNSRYYLRIQGVLKSLRCQWWV